MNDTDTQVTDAVAGDTDNLEDFSKAFFSGDTEAAETPDTETDDLANADDTPEADGDEPEDDGNDEDAEEAVEAGDPEPEPEPKKGRKPAKERIEELVAKNHDLYRQLEAALEQVKASKSSGEEDETPAEKRGREHGERMLAEVPDGPKPDDILDDGELKYPLGEFDPLFIRDLTRHTIAKETANAKAEAAAEAEAEEIAAAKAQLNTEWREKLEQATEEIPDLREKALGLDDTFRGIDPAYGEYLAATMMSLPNGAYILNYLAENVDEARRIVNSGATAATLTLGRLDAKFAGEHDEDPKPSKSVSTKAKAPPPINKGSGRRLAVQADTDDLDAFEKAFFVKK